MKKPSKHGLLAGVAGGLIALSCAAFAQEIPIVDGRVNVVDENLAQVFLRRQPFLPGEKVTLSVQYKVDAMRRMYEDRECWSDWFGGIDCHYVKASEASGLGEANVPLILDLRDQSGAEMNPSVIPARGRGDDFDPLPRLQGSGRVFSLRLDDNDVRAAFAMPHFLYGRVAAFYGTPGATQRIQRKPCSPHRNHEHCSQGEYVIQIESVDVSRRLAKLPSYLATRRSFGEISSQYVIDDWLKFDVVNGKMVPAVARRAEIATLLLRHVSSYYALSGGPPHPDRGSILAFAKGLSPDDPRIRSEIVLTQLASGEVAAARSENQEMIKDLSKRYADGDRRPVTLLGYSQALSNAGAIQLERRNGAPSLGDAELAASLYSQSAVLWDEYRRAVKGRMEEEEEAIEGLVRARREEARVWRMVGDQGALDRAIAALTAARQILPRQRRGAVMNVSADDRHLLALDVPFAEMADAHQAEIALAFLPARTNKVLDVDARAGRALVELSSGETLRLDLANPGVLSPVGVPLGVRLAKARLSPVGVVGVDAATGALLRFEALPGIVVADAASRPWAAARESDAILYGNDQGGLTLVRGAASYGFAPGTGTLQMLEIANDGNTAFVVQRESDGDYLRTVPLAAAAPGTIRSYRIGSASRVRQIVPSVDGKHVLVLRDADIAALEIGSDSVRVAPASLSAEAGATALWGSRFALAGAGDGMLKSVRFVDAARLVAGTALESQAEDVSNAVSLNLTVPATNAAILVTDGARQRLALTVASIGVPDAPAVIRTYGIDGSAVGAFPLEDWRPGSTFISGDYLGQNVASGRSSVRTPLAGGTAETFQGAVTRTGEPGVLLVPLHSGRQSRLALVSRNDDGEIVQIRILADSAGPEVTHDIAAPGAGAKWRLIASERGPLTPDAQALHLIAVAGNVIPIAPAPTRETYDAAYAQAPVQTSRVLTVGIDGGLTENALGLRAPDKVIAIVNGLPIEAREWGLAWAEPDGTSHYLSDCGASPATCGQNHLFQPDSGSVLIARRSPTALSVALWAAAPDGATRSYRCLACDAFDSGKWSDLVRRYPGGVEPPAFAIGPDGWLMAPIGGTVQAGPAAESNWSRDIARLGLPIWPGPDTLIVQSRPDRFDIWQEARN
jgi:hypothetical protein